MRRTEIANTGLEVSRVCLGSMTWGLQNNESEAHAQLDLATERGVNLIDTAEMYAIPPTAETYGTTETMIGNWFAAAPSRRDRVVLMSKICGSGLPWIRNGEDITPTAIHAAIEDSLRRLQTDVIDVYQLHWPNRPNPHFNRHMPGAVSFGAVDAAAECASLLALMQALDEAIRAGKIRHYGVSNDTPWGLMTLLRLAREHHLPAPVSVQNEFNLLHAKDWPYMAEACTLENIAYFSWSPLAGGALSGKYLDGTPAGSRWSLNNRHGNFRDTKAVAAAVREYRALAAEAGMTTAQLALAWCHQFDWVTSTIIGATGVEQLAENLDAFDMQPSDATLAQIQQIFRRFPQPF